LADLADGLLPFLDLLLRVGEEVVGMAVIVGAWVLGAYVTGLPDLPALLLFVGRSSTGDKVGIIVVGSGVIVGLIVGDAEVGIAVIVGE